MKSLPLACLLFSLCPSLDAADYYVSPSGQDNAPGTAQAPFRSLARALAGVKKSAAAPGSTVWLTDGVHTLTETVELGAGFSGTATAPFTIRAVHPGRATVSGGTLLPATGFRPLAPPAPTGPTATTRSPQPADLLQPAARPHVVCIRLTGTPAADALDQPSALLASRSWTLTTARWPDKGYALIGKISSPGAIWISGRSLGKRTTGTMQNPVGGEFTFQETWHGDWARELAAGFGTPRVQGYFSADWWFERDRIARVQAGKITLLSDSRYGLGSKEKLPRRVFVSGLISELDRPGEWFWDNTAKELYLWPIAPDAPVTLAGNFDLFSLKNAAHVIIRDLILELGQNGVVVSGGEHVTIAGCAVRNLPRTGIKIEGGRFHRIQSCDIYNLEIPLSVQGTAAANYTWDSTTHPPHLVGDGHVITNNHIGNILSGRGISLGGVGITFSHNLIHDLPGSAVTWSGNDHVFEYNEMFSLMKELGDWGATYSGASWCSFGNVFRYNFIHHLLSLPEAHPANGFYFDDHKAGDTTYGNVFYKVGYRAVMCNGGGAQTVVNNIFINNYINVYQTDDDAEKARDEKVKYDAGELKRGDKSDFWWRTEQAVGKNGWERAPWSEAYPAFKRLMEGDPYSPGQTVIARNYELGTIKEAIHLNKVPDGCVEATPMHPISEAAFINPAALNFAFRPEFKPVAGFERIPFEQIGLVKDEYRPNPPAKDQYRGQVRELNKGYAPYDPDARYDSKTINDRLYPDPPYWSPAPAVLPGK